MVIIEANTEPLAAVLYITTTSVMDYAKNYPAREDITSSSEDEIILKTINTRRSHSEESDVWRISSWDESHPSFEAKMRENWSMDNAITMLFLMFFLIIACLCACKKRQELRQELRQHLGHIYSVPPNSSSSTTTPPHSTYEPMSDPYTNNISHVTASQQSGTLPPSYFSQDVASDTPPPTYEEATQTRLTEERRTRNPLRRQDGMCLDDSLVPV